MGESDFNARQSVDQAFLLLADRLEPLIAAVLAPHLGGLPWIALLEQRDHMHGREPRHYVATDPQTQLKVLTERMGSIGFPFDDTSRTVSILGGELRIVRNRWAHHGELTTLDAWRTHDFVVRLLTRLSDEDGAASAADLREAAFAALAREKGIAAHAQPLTGAALAAPVADAEFGISASESTSEPEDGPLEVEKISTPAAQCEHSVLNDADDALADVAQATSDDAFEPWPIVTVGEPDVIDNLPKKVAKERLRAVAAEIVDYEGPIQLRRLAQLTAASFGIARLHAKREKSISYQIQQIEGITVDADKFVWPAGVNAHTWMNYRPSTPNQHRDFLSISPVEVANAIRTVVANNPEATTDDVDREVLGVFGKSRLTAAFRAHLTKARSRL